MDGWMYHISESEFWDDSFVDKAQKRKQQSFKDNDDQAYRDSVNIISITVTKSQKHTA